MGDSCALAWTSRRRRLSWCATGAPYSADQFGSIWGRASRAFIGCACRAPATARVALEGPKPLRTARISRATGERACSLAAGTPSYVARRGVWWSASWSGVGRSGPEVAVASRPIPKARSVRFNAAPAATATGPAASSFASPLPARAESAGSAPHEAAMSLISVHCGLQPCSHCPAGRSTLQFRACASVQTP